MPSLVTLENLKVVAIGIYCAAINLSIADGNGLTICHQLLQFTNAFAQGNMRSLFNMLTGKHQYRVPIPCGLDDLPLFIAQMIQVHAGDYRAENSCVGFLYRFYAHLYAPILG